MVKNSSTSDNLRTNSYFKKLIQLEILLISTYFSTILLPLNQIQIILRT